MRNSQEEFDTQPLLQIALSKKGATSFSISKSSSLYFELRPLACSVIRDQRDSSQKVLLYKIRATFHPPLRCRIANGEIIFNQLQGGDEPEKGMILDIEPKESSYSEPTVVTTKSGTQFNFRAHVAEYNKQDGSESSYSVLSRAIQGSVVSSGKIARWTFDEHPDAKTGIPLHTDLYIVIEGEKPPVFEVEVNIRTRGRGLLDAVGDVQEFFSGTLPTEREKMRIQLPIPDSSHSKGELPEKPNQHSNSTLGMLPIEESPSRSVQNDFM